MHRSANGTYAFGREEFEIKGGEIIYKDVGPIGVMVTEPNANAAAEPTLGDLKELLIAACGTDFGVHSPTWISRFTDTTRQAAAYRSGRVLLAGDAAHVHSPIGGQGLSTGVQDAVNLGWKLAQVIKGTSPDSLLDTYHAERHPVGARVLKTTMAQVALHREDDRTLAARDIVGELLTMEEPRKRIAGMMSGLDIRYDLGRGIRCSAVACPISTSSPQAARGASSASCTTLGRCCSTSPRRAPSTSLRGQTAFSTSTRHTTARGSFRCSAKSLRPPPVLIRPDGYVAWVGDGTAQGLTEALTTWFGTPAR